MKTTIKKIIEWFGKSNRYKHLLYAIVVSYLAGFVFTCGVAAGMEFKDAQWGGKGDWIDFWLTEAEYNARLAELDDAYITGLEEDRGYGNRQYRMQQFERMEEAQRRMREAIGKRDRFGVKLLEKGDTGDYVIARMENGVTMQKIILSPLEARLLASEILSKVKPIRERKSHGMSSKQTG